MDVRTVNVFEQFDDNTTRRKPPGRHDAAGCDAYGSKDAVCGDDPMMFSNEQRSRLPSMEKRVEGPEQFWRRSGEVIHVARSAGEVAVNLAQEVGYFFEAEARIAKGDTCPFGEVSWRRRFVTFEVAEGKSAECLRAGERRGRPT